MPKYICKLEGMYFEWSTVVDAPTTYGMTLEDFTAYYRERYGSHDMDAPDDAGFAARMRRVEAKGTSTHCYDSVEELVEGNRAGPDESELTVPELAEFLRNRLEPDVIKSEREWVKNAIKTQKGAGDE